MPQREKRGSNWNLSS